ncbi:GlcNAc-PI de-N-acetylase [Legionella sainthelensi]|uniref:GlcNAc-PI de-N-acetylase n=1 Tax=Legionella sainthelensi TaxID=28087 RepID=A0A0W0YPC4_9GAMM|nr:PIG-L family deacetylase [Legionella sainthelensi]KTD58729.1 GlcNAc-PI de-N-acetylase [Legionella sainthelensi]VEH34730.1 Uncharacterized proteins, LmbE homologs [Legionella sainthelensi]
MRTNASLVNNVRLFVFAHQDDEFGVFQSIKQAVIEGKRVYCAYLTDGGARTSPAQRNKESLSVLSKLGVDSNDVFFVGESLGIKDGYFIHHMNSAIAWLDDWFSNYENIEFIYVPAWEGGHHDHDALHAVTVFSAHKKNLLQRVRQFPLYNAFSCLGPMFKVLTPLLENGELIKHHISWRNRLFFTQLCFSYPSQFKTWLGLLPCVTLHFFRHGVEFNQPVSLERLLNRPHNGPLYYEKRKFLSWDEMERKINTSIRI